MSKLLIDEPPLQVLPSLAVAVGLNEALILQQVHYWIGQKKQTPDKNRETFRSGEWWVYNSVPEWNEQFKFWGDNTIRRALSSLRQQGLLIAEQLSEDPRDKTLWYRIDYEKLETVTAVVHKPKGSSKKKWVDASTQNGQMAYPEWADGNFQDGQMHLPKMGRCLSETPSETPKRIPQRVAPAGAPNLASPSFPEKKPDRKEPEQDRASAPWPFGLLPDAERASWLDAAEAELRENFGLAVWLKTKEKTKASIREQRATNLYSAMRKPPCPQELPGDG